MDKIEKFLRKLNKKEYETFLLLMEQLKKDFKQIPGIKKLVGLKDYYRIRIGRYRLIFKVLQNNNVEIIKITKRDENTYKDLM